MIFVSPHHYPFIIYIQSFSHSINRMKKINLQKLSLTPVNFFSSVVEDVLRDDDDENR